MTSLAGIATAIATIMTSVVAVLGLQLNHKSSQLGEAHQTVTHQAQQISALKARPTPTATVTVSASPTPSASSSPSAPSTASPGNGPDLTPVAHYLSALQPTVEDGDLGTGQEVISAKPYVHSIAFDCNGGGGGNLPDEAYDVAGSSIFVAKAGIADDMQNATDVIATITFTNEAGQQIGRAYQVSLGHPVRVHLNITGVTQLGMSCSGRDRHTSEEEGDFQVALGNAGVS
jgi:hypothetical protein